MTTIKRIGPTIAAMLIAALIAVAGYAAGQDPQGGRPPFPGRGGPGGPFGRGPGGPGGPLGLIGLPLDRLGLTDAEREQVKAIMDAHQAELRALGEREMTARRALEDAIAADVAVEATIRAHSAELAAIEADMAVMRARVRAEVFQILTPEQQAQVRQIQTEMKQRSETMRQRRGQPQQGPPR